VEHHPDCACCKHNLPFDFPDYLIEEVRSGRCVIFAGAGISTESKHVLPWTFYDEIRDELDIKDDLSFPELMTRFIDQPVGRTKLITKLQERFDYIDQWADLRKRANSFHRELSTMPYISEVVTTNWDTYFEEYAGMKPFVYDADIPFWEASKKSVLKIHGSIENLSTLVATSEDYEHCYKRLNEGLLGTILKQILATKTCVLLRCVITFVTLQMKLMITFSTQSFMRKENISNFWMKFLSSIIQWLYVMSFVTSTLAGT